MWLHEVSDHARKPYILNTTCINVCESREKYVSFKNKTFYLEISLLFAGMPFSMFIVPSNYTALASISLESRAQHINIVRWLCLWFIEPRYDNTYVRLYLITVKKHIPSKHNNADHSRLAS